MTEVLAPPIRAIALEASNTFLHENYFFLGIFKNEILILRSVTRSFIL